LLGTTAKMKKISGTEKKGSVPEGEENVSEITQTRVRRLQKAQGVSRGLRSFRPAVKRGDGYDSEETYGLGAQGVGGSWMGGKYREKI